MTSMCFINKNFTDSTCLSSPFSNRYLTSIWIICLCSVLISFICQKSFQVLVIQWWIVQSSSQIYSNYIHGYICIWSLIFYTQKMNNEKIKANLKGLCLVTRYRNFLSGKEILLWNFAQRKVVSFFFFFFFLLEHLQTKNSIQEDLNECLRGNSMIEEKVMVWYILF